MFHCGSGYPRDYVFEKADQSIAQDPLRKDLWQCHLCRDCRIMDPHMPAVSFGLQSNSDAQPVAPKHGPKCIVASIVANITRV